MKCSASRLWRICLERAHGFMLRLDARALASYPAAVAAVLVCAAVISLKIYQQPETARRCPPESASFVGAGEHGRRMEPDISGGHADFQNPAGSQF